MNKIFLLFLSALLTYPVFSQENEQWYLQNTEPDMFSTSADAAYTSYGQKAQKTITVAVLDSGVDADHEDLIDNMWVNPGEIAGNGIDDDGNGYVDDIHGWNFLGNAEGEVMDAANLEITRIYRDYARKYLNKPKADLSAEEKKEYKEWLAIKKEFTEKFETATEDFAFTQQLFQVWTVADEMVVKHLGKEEYTDEEISKINSSDRDLMELAAILLELRTLGMDEDLIQELLEESNSEVEYHYNPNFDPRPEIIGDDHTDFSNQVYGNNIVDDPNGHGTHVAGIIGAVRNNNLGIDGIAPNVKIMAVRVVPNGDEYDKDVANGIYYAVDNGAQIINMSFGKDYSPHKSKVDEAVRYAASKNVIVVHAAGNDAQNIDKISSFPDPFYLSGERADNYVSVGASSAMPAEYVIAEFSNYGKEKVDVFAPGVEIYSTYPDNAYENNDGTSMAAPVVSGALAFLWSVYPEKNYREIISMLKESTTDFSNFKLYLPSEKIKRKKTKGGKLCNTGGVIHLRRALDLGKE